MSVKPVIKLNHSIQMSFFVDLPGIHTLSLSGNAFRVWQSANPDPTNTPMLISGQAVTNGVNGVYWGTSDTASIYVQAISNGTSILTYSYLGTGDANGIVCRASLKMTTFSVNVINIYEMLNVCNRVPNPKQNTSKRLFIATEPTDDLAKFRVAGSTYPVGLSDQIKVGLFDGSTCVETGYLQNDGEWAFYIAPSANVKTYQLKFGVDQNGDGVLQANECGQDVDFSVTAFNSAEYNTQRSWLSENADLAAPVYPVGATMLRKFLSEDNLPDPPSDSAIAELVNCFTLGSLTHNAGESFSPSGSGWISKYPWDKYSDAGMTIANSVELELVVSSALTSLTNTVLSYFASHPDVTVYTISTALTNMPINFAETSQSNLQEYDLHIAFGHATVCELVLVCEFVKLSSNEISAGTVSCQGVLEDLYDFNYEDGGLAQRAAKVQLGWDPESGWRSAGRMFFEKVLFEKTCFPFPFIIFNN